MKRDKLKEILRPIVSEALSDYLKDTEKDLSALQKQNPQLDLDDTPVEYGIQKEASTSDGAGPFMTPNAFSDNGPRSATKRKKISQQLGMKLVKENRLEEELRFNIINVLQESYTPKLQTPEAKMLHHKMLDYVSVTDDPKFSIIHKFRVLIDRVYNNADKQQLIRFFNDEFAITWGSVATSAWDYYKKPNEGTTKNPAGSIGHSNIGNSVGTWNY